MSDLSKSGLECGTIALLESSVVDPYILFTDSDPGPLTTEGSGFRIQIQLIRGIKNY